MKNFLMIFGSLSAGVYCCTSMSSDSGVHDQESAALLLDASDGMLSAGAYIAQQMRLIHDQERDQCMPCWRQLCGGCDGDVARDELVERVASKYASSSERKQLEKSSNRCARVRGCAVLGGCAGGIKGIFWLQSAGIASNPAMPIVPFAVGAACYYGVTACEHLRRAQILNNIARANKSGIRLGALPEVQMMLPASPHQA